MSHVPSHCHTESAEVRFGLLLGVGRLLALLLLLQMGRGWNELKIKIATQPRHKTVIEKSKTRELLTEMLDFFLLRSERTFAQLSRKGRVRPSCLSK